MPKFEKLDIASVLVVEATQTMFGTTPNGESGPSYSHGNELFAPSRLRPELPAATMWRASGHALNALKIVLLAPEPPQLLFVMCAPLSQA